MILTHPGNLFDVFNSASGSSGNKFVARTNATGYNKALIVISFSNNILWFGLSLCVLSNDATLATLILIVMK